MLLERASLCSKPESLPPKEFTLDQVKKAVEEIFKELHRKAIANAHEIITQLRDTELLADEVYRGPATVRVEDVIPVSGIIFVANVSAITPTTVLLGWGTVLEPMYLVINTFGFGVESDTRYGVFKICVYELIKQNLVVETEGGLNLTVTLDADGVFISSDKNRLYLV